MEQLLISHVEGEDFDQKLAPYLAELTAMKRQFRATLDAEEPSDEDLLREIFSSVAIVMIIDESNRPKGFATLERLTGDKWELSSAYVIPEEREKGHWNKMTDLLLAEAKRLGAIAIEVVPALHSEFLVGSLLKRGFVYINQDVMRLTVE